MAEGGYAHVELMRSFLALGQPRRRLRRNSCFATRRPSRVTRTTICSPRCAPWPAMTRVPGAATPSKAASGAANIAGE